MLAEERPQLTQTHSRQQIQTTCPLPGRFAASGSLEIDSPSSSPQHISRRASNFCWAEENKDANHLHELIKVWPISGTSMTADVERRICSSTLSCSQEGTCNKQASSGHCGSQCCSNCIGRCCKTKNIPPTKPGQPAVRRANASCATNKEVASVLSWPN